MASLTHIDTESSNLVPYRSPKPTTIDLVGGIFCSICDTTYANKREYDMHYFKHGTDIKDIVYTCVVCRKEIAGYPSFRGHCYTSHVIKDRYKCEHCKKLFSKSPALKDHMNTMHRFKCNSCNKEFTSKKELQLHQIIHNNTDMPPFKCQACEEKIETLSDCKEHVDMHSASVYFCPICNENISSCDDAPEHLKKHFGDYIEENQELIQRNLIKDESFIEQLGGISCRYCPLIYKDRVEFDAHFSCDHGSEDIIYTCNVCGKEFEKYSAFSDHSYNHFMKDRFCCDICQKAFNRLSLLVTHMAACKTNNDASGKPFACFKCDNRYANEMRLRFHLRDTHAIHWITCPVEGCEEIFSSPKELINHQNEHRSQQNYCKQCGLLFTNLISCERHLEFHKKKLYVCPVCNRNYGEKYLILKHLPQHFETVLHLCKVCGKVYNAKNRLIEHMKTHSVTKTHKCNYCGKGFVKIGHLQQHLNVHTGSKPYKCPICSKSFASHPNWHKHLQRMHKVDGKKYKKSVKITPDIEDSESDSMEDIEEDESPPTVKSEIQVEVVEIDQSNMGDPQKNSSFNAQLHVDISEALMYQEPDDSTMESDSIDQIIIEKELEIFEGTTSENMKNVIEFINVPNGSTSLVDEGAQTSSGAVPAEYGPEFSLLDLDDHHMPHIDPLLTIKTRPPSPSEPQPHEPQPHGPHEPRQPKWEPLITKVYPDYYEMLETNRFSINTDIY